MPVTRAVVDRQARIEIATPDTEAEQMDATMKYAAFVAWWSGVTLGMKQPPGWDAGVTGVTVSATLPPTKCAVVAPAPGEPAGTQAAWVFGDGSVLVDVQRPVRHGHDLPAVARRGDRVRPAAVRRPARRILR